MGMQSCGMFLSPNSYNTNIYIHIDTLVLQQTETMALHILTAEATVHVMTVVPGEPATATRLVTTSTAPTWMTTEIVGSVRILGTTWMLLATPLTRIDPIASAAL